jgi:AcrR family transcriptional regulator
MAVTPKKQGQHHHGALRRALLDAVAEIVLEKGPDAVSLRECARRAGVSHSAAAPHFGDKRGLLTAFATERSERLAAAMRDAVAALPEGADPKARLYATGQGYIAFARQNPAHFRMMFRTDQVDTTDPEWRAAVNASWQPLQVAMEAVAAGADTRAMRARLVFAWSAVHGFCTLRAEGASGTLLSPEAQAEEVAADMLALLVEACG